MTLYGVAVPGALKTSMLIVPEVGTFVFPGAENDQEFDERISVFTSPFVKVLSLPQGDEVRLSVAPVLLVSVIV